MAYTIQSPLGRIEYFDDYGFDYIAQFRDEHGIMFANYTKERAVIGFSTNAVAVFRITKRKTKQFSLNNGVPVNIGDIVFYVANSGLAGIFEYQYAGTIISSFDKTEYHLFLSEYLVSTVSIKVGNERRSISYDKLFSTLEDATKYKNQSGRHESL